MANNEKDIFKIKKIKKIKKFNYLMDISQPLSL